MLLWQQNVSLALKTDKINMLLSKNMTLAVRKCSELSSQTHRCIKTKEFFHESCCWESEKADSLSSRRRSRSSGVPTIIHKRELKRQNQSLSISFFEHGSLSLLHSSWFCSCSLTKSFCAILQRSMILFGKYMHAFSHSFTVHTHKKYISLWQHRHGRRSWWHSWVTAVVGPVAVPEPTQRGWWRGWRCRWRRRGAVWPQNGPSSAAVRSRPWFRGVGEGEGGGINDSIVADQRDGDLHWLSHPAPTLPEGRNVRHHTQDALSTSYGADRWDIAWVLKPSSQCRLTNINTHLYIVSASTSPNHTLRLGVKFWPVSSNMATSPPPFNFTQPKQTKRVLCLFRRWEKT